MIEQLIRDVAESRKRPADAVNALLKENVTPKYLFVLWGDGWGERYPKASVLDNVTGEQIGEADSYTYGGTAWAVHTDTFAGYLSFDNPLIDYGNQVGEYSPWDDSSTEMYP